MVSIQNLLISFFRSGLPVIGTALGVFYAMRLMDRNNDSLPDQVGSLGSPATASSYDPANPSRRPDAPPVGEPPPGPQPPRGTSQVIGASGEVLATGGPPTKTEHPRANVEGTLFSDAYGQGVN
jgi:hypothetical protein